MDIYLTFVSLKSELANTENYLRIQQTLYEDKISYRIQGEEELLSVSVPKLILQPIVENAIYHGIRPQAVRGILRLDMKNEKAISSLRFLTME